MKNEETIEEQDDIYDEITVEAELEADEITVNEAAFMEGYDREIAREQKTLDANATDKWGLLGRRREKKWNAPGKFVYDPIVSCIGNQYR